jgi:hypothetical protein
VKSEPDRVEPDAPSLTETLCTRCGLCCDGSLFADVELGGKAESTRLEILGLEIEDDEANRALLIQPCAALRGRRCDIYEHRPKCCRTFECRLLLDTRRGAVGVARALEHIENALSGIARAERLLSHLGVRDRRLPLKERCDEALAADAHAAPAVRAKQAELESVAFELDLLLRTTFLGESGRPARTAPSANVT